MPYTHVFIQLLSVKEARRQRRQQKKYNNQIIAAASSSPPHTHTQTHTCALNLLSTHSQLSIKCKHRVATSFCSAFDFAAATEKWSNQAKIKTQKKSIKIKQQQVTRSTKRNETKRFEMKDCRQPVRRCCCCCSCCYFPLLLITYPIHTHSHTSALRKTRARTPTNDPIGDHIPPHKYAKFCWLRKVWGAPGRKKQQKAKRG